MSVTKNCLMGQCLVVLFFTSGPAWSNEYCSTITELRKKITYCDENFTYYEAAKSCKEKYLSVVKSRINPVLENISSIEKTNNNEAAQSNNFAQTSLVLSESIEEIHSLINYGKDVHTELEEYVYELIYPAMNESEANANIDDPKVLAEFMTRECYGDPRAQIELMEREIRPVVEDLEKTVAKAIALRNITKAGEANLKSVVKIDNSEAPRPSSSDSKPRIKATRKIYRASDISGTEDKGN